MVVQYLQLGNRTIINLSYDEMLNFCGNCLEVGDNCLAISKRAFDSLTEDHRAEIQKFLKPIVVDLSTIENVGGGGFRCMLAGVYLPKLK